MPADHEFTSIDDDALATIAHSPTGVTKEKPHASTISLIQLYREYELPKGTPAIRVVDLARASSQDDPLSGTLRVARLEECPSFDALSYAWGRGDRVISCDWCLVPFTPNCHGALV